jgi:ABC-2 type transport system ATP-binding protein
MALVERLCTHIAVVGGGRVLASGELNEVRGGSELEERFVELVGDDREHRDLTWLRPS